MSQSPYEDVPDPMSRRRASFEAMPRVLGAEGASAEGISVSSSRRFGVRRQAYAHARQTGGRNAHVHERPTGAECAMAHPAAGVTRPLRDNDAIDPLSGRHEIIQRFVTPSF